MPLLLLTIRLQVESIFRNTYPAILSDPDTEQLAMRLTSCLITEVLDPQLYYSRFSFLESGKNAIDIKNRMFKMQNLKSVSAEKGNSPFFPNVKGKFYTRSTLVKNLFPIPSEGKVRAMFVDQPVKAAPQFPSLGTARRSNTIGRKILGVDERSKSPFINASKMVIEGSIGSRMSLPSNFHLKTAESRMK